jgi:CTP synthase
MLVCRTSESISPQIIEKISIMCDIDNENIIEGKNVKSIYEVPNKLKVQKVDRIILDYFGYKKKKSDLSNWNKLVRKIIIPKKEITISII